MSNFDVALSVRAWRAWSPGLNTEQQWQQWSDAGAPALDTLVDSAAAPKPDVSMVPPMLRRRLSEVGKLAMSVAWPLLPEAGITPLLFCSQHGDQARTLQLMAQLAEQEALSPAAFSMSVHNAVAGVMSIARKVTGPISAMAADQQMLSSALCEAYGQLHSGEHQQLLLVIYDLPLPAVYATEIAPAHPFALALLLQRAGENSGGQRVSARLTESKAPLSTGNEALHWLAWLLGGDAQLSLHGSRNCWQWQK